MPVAPLLVRRTNRIVGGLLGTSPPYSLATQSAAMLVLEADLLTGLTDGQSIQTWPNAIIPIGNNATQPNAGSRPIYKTGILNGYPSVRVDGATQAFQEAFCPTGAKSVVLVYKVITIPATGSYTFMRLKTSGGLFMPMFIRKNIGGGGTFAVLGDTSTTATTLVSCNPSLDTSPHILIATWSGGTNTSAGSYTFMHDGVAQTSTAETLTFTAVASDLGSIGARILSTGSLSGTSVNLDILAFGVVGKQLSSTEMTTISRGYGGKYGITVP